MEWIKCSDRMPEPKSWTSDNEDDFMSELVLCSNGKDIWMGFYTHNIDGKYKLMINDIRVGKSGWWTDSGFSCCSFPGDEDYIWWAIPTYPNKESDGMD